MNNSGEISIIFILSSQTAYLLIIVILQLEEN